MFRLEDCDNWTVKDLKDQLRTYSLKVSGNKDQLCMRLADHIAKRPSPPPAQPVVKPPAKAPAIKMEPLLPRKPIEKLIPLAKEQPATVHEFDSCMQMSVVQIRDELRKYNQKLTGTKDVLCRRLLEARTVGEARQTAPTIAIPAAATASPKLKRLATASPKGATPRQLQAKIFTLADCQNWTLVQLQDRLRELKLKVSGNKSELCQRLADHYKQQLPPTKKLHNIIFAEPYTLTPAEVRKIRPIGINDRMYNIIKLGPQAYTTHRGRKCEGNAYVFGPLLDVDEYTKIASHGNDGAQTGFVDLDINLTTNNSLDDIDQWERAYPNLMWDNPVALRRIQQELPEILFVGETVGGDVGATLYAHYDVNGEIDSLIIENSCIFGDDE